MNSRIGSVAATTVGALLLCVGILAGVVNRQVLDGPRFARHVDAVMRDPAVSRQVGQAITARLVAVDPDLVAVRPLVEATVTALAGSPSFGPVVRLAARQLHRAFTDGSAGPVSLRVADLGVVLAGVLPTLAPQLEARVPAGLTVTLAQVGQRSYAARTIHLAHLVRLLAWLLPLLAVLAFTVGLLLAPDRPRALVRTGWAIFGAGVGLGVVALGGEIIGSTADEETLRGALVAAVWRRVDGPFWWAAAIAVIAGALVVAVATARVPQVDLATGRRIWTWVSRRPVRPSGRIVRGAVLVIIGAAAVVNPSLVINLVVAAAGLLLLVVGVGEVASAVDTSRLQRRRGRWRWRVPAVAALGVAVAIVVALVVVDTASVDQRISAAAGPRTGCNGHVELCGRRYDDVAFVATHNAMSAADQPGWFIPEQPTGLVGQLDDGVRALLIDTWYGQATNRSGLVATTAGGHADALAEAERLYGQKTVTSALRLRDALAPKPVGPATPYLCHSLCELGSTKWEPVMADVHAWLETHPREVVTFFIQDAVSPADTAAVFKQAGLLPYVHTQVEGQPWPTLGEMIDSGRRVVVLMENHAGGKKYPWLLEGFHWTQDTPYANPAVAKLSCRLERGSPTSPLFLVNYWLNNYQSLVSDARKINAIRVLAPYLEKCRRQRDRLPNYVAVNYYDKGDVFRAVDDLNGVS